MSDDLIKALQKEAQEDAKIITFLRAANEKLNVALDVCRKEANKAADEITRLRAENEKLRRLVERIVEHHEHDESEVSGWTQWETLVKDARAALEGVTEKEGAGNE